ncbi:MAG: TetR/AcrR family transcriptional regulator [Bacillota bacterium]|nr:TetR/AcrR family transcriptional regulator [Bacillota bacterium]
MKKVLENKSKKMTRLREAAYELFTSNGIPNTRIDDIVKKAGIAKGTFYLYCKDKYDLVDKVILRKTTDIINNAMKAIAENQNAQDTDFLENVIVFADYLLEHFKRDKKLLALIYKNLSWDLYEKALTFEELGTAEKTFIEHFTKIGGDSEVAKQRLFIIVSMVGAVCYNSIVLEMPYPIDLIKPELYRSVTRILVQ